MDAQPTEANVIIVGGGLAGLTAACYLARAGVGVTVYEKAPTVGGRAASQPYDGYQFNRGIHALYTGGAAESAFNQLGIAYTGRRPQGIYLLKQGRLHLAPVNPLTLLRTSALGAADKLELMRLFMALPTLNAHELRQVNVQDWIQQTVRRPVVRQFMVANARTAVYTTALDRVSAEVFVAKLQTLLKHPVVYIDGGWQTLVDGMRRAAEQAGAKIVSGTRVEAVECANGHVTGVGLQDGSLKMGANVILATTPQEAVKLIDGQAYPALRQAVNHLLPAQLACLDVALRLMPDPRHPVVQDMEQPCFMSAQSLFSRVAPDGGAMIYTFKQLDPHQASDPRQDERVLEHLLDTAQPGWREVLVKRQYLPRIQAIGALPAAESGGFAGRPDTQVAGLAGLYVAGDWVGSEGFLADASIASARRAAQLILDSRKQQTRILAR